MQRLGIEMIACLLAAGAREGRRRMFRTHQARLPGELAHTGIMDMAAANRYLAEVYVRPSTPNSCSRPRRKAVPSSPGLVAPWTTSCASVSSARWAPDNCVSFEGRRLQIPADRHRCHYVKAKVAVLRRIDRALAIFHGPRKLADYDPDGQLRAPNLQVAT